MTENLFKGLKILMKYMYHTQCTYAMYGQIFVSGSNEELHLEEKDRKALTKLGWSYHDKDQQWYISTDGV